MEFVYGTLQLVEISVFFSVIVVEIRRMFSFVVMVLSKYYL